MNDSPLLLLVMSAASVWVGKMWLEDMRAARAGKPTPGAWPGSVPAAPRAVWIGCAGAAAITAAETWGEARLGLTAQQSRVTWLFGLYTLLAPMIEELIFRGYLVIEGRGRAALWGGAVAASLAFAFVHPFLWRWEGGLVLTLTAKGAFSTVAVFATSLWLYAARFGAWNPSRSLLPCIAGHAAKNMTVLAIKFAQGFVGGAW